MNIQLENATVLKNVPQTDEYHLLEFSAPYISAAARPGQFVHLQIPGRRDILLRRPFSIYKAQQDTLSILFKAIGQGTGHMKSLVEGQAVSLLGPLGHGFPDPDTEKQTILIAGGYGMAALYLTAKSTHAKGILFAGGAREKDILCASEFSRLGWEVHIATEDGSLGSRGLVTHILDHWFTQREDKYSLEIFACGPMGMLRAISLRAQQWNCPAWISLDHYMACGVGACLACVHKINRDGAEKLACTCKEGPVFESREIVWESI